jgi:cytidylate kinase
MSKPFHIAIDGPVAAGKGTISRLVAQRLGFLYVDTGAMYRMTALLALANKVDFKEEEKIVELVNNSLMEMRNPIGQEQDGRLTTVILNGEDVSWKIRTPEATDGSSKVAILPKVREALVKKQQIIAADQSVIMEGRDITSKVLPAAQMKIYLTASDIVRAKRRHLELQIRGIDVGFDQVYRELIERDERDMNRAADPLHIVEGAWIVDTSDLSIEKVVDLIVARANLIGSVP